MRLRLRFRDCARFLPGELRSKLLDETCEMYKWVAQYRTTLCKEKYYFPEQHIILGLPHSPEILSLATSLHDTEVDCEIVKYDQSICLYLKDHELFLTVAETIDL